MEKDKEMQERKQEQAKARKQEQGRARKQEQKRSPLKELLGYAGPYKGLTFTGLALSAVAMILGMIPYICIWLVVRDLIKVAPNWALATDIGRYGWMAFGAAVAGILVYFAALMFTHLAAFRTASNIRIGNSLM